MFKFRQNLVATAGLLALVTACSDPAGPAGLVMTGTWQGSSTLPNAFSTTLTLTQAGTAVSGTIRISGVMTAERQINGQVNSGARTYTWAVVRDCELWAGVLTVSQDGQQMTGPLVIDRIGCVPAQSNGSGTMTLTRQ